MHDNHTAPHHRPNLNMQQSLPSFSELMSELPIRDNVRSGGSQPSSNTLPSVRASVLPLLTVEDGSAPRSFASNSNPRAMPSLAGAYGDGPARSYSYTPERQLAHRRPSVQAAHSPPVIRSSPHFLKREHLSRRESAETSQERGYYYTAPRHYSPSSNGHSSNASAGHSPELPGYASRRPSLYDPSARTAYPPIGGAPIASPSLDRYGSDYRYGNPAYDRATIYPVSYGMGDQQYQPHFISESRGSNFGVGVMTYGEADMKNKRRRGNLPKPVTDILRAWFMEHLDHPYPSEEDKQTFMQRTGLSISQISNWFINARRRQLPTLRNIRAQENARHQRPNSQTPSISPREGR